MLRDNIVNGGCLKNNIYTEIYLLKDSKCLSTLGYLCPYLRVVFADLNPVANKILSLKSARVNFKFSIDSPELITSHVPHQ